MIFPTMPLYQLLQLLALVGAAAGAVCTGASAKLAADQCAAWGQLFDATGGPHWTNVGPDGSTTTSSKTDPCAGCGYSVTCSADGTSITNMYVPTLSPCPTAAAAASAPPLPRRACDNSSSLTR